MTETIWVTGAHGFIGRNLARYISSQGIRVAGLGHGLWPEVDAAREGVSCWINGSISASNLHLLASRIGRPDCVIHLAGGSSVGAAMAQPREDFLRTVAGTAELLEWVRIESPETSIVAVSSAAVYGAGHDGPISETAVLTPYSPYGEHKLMMESLCRSYGATFGVRSVIARLFSVYGAGLQKQLLWDLCCKLDVGPTVVELGGSGDELRDWTDVDDVVCMLAEIRGQASVSAPSFNVATGAGASVRQVAQTVLERWAVLRGDKPKLAFSARSRPGDPFSLVADVERLARLGLRADVGMRSGISKYVDWYVARAQSLR